MAQKDRREYNSHLFQNEAWNRRKYEDRREYKTPFKRFMTMPVKVFVRRTKEEFTKWYWRDTWM
jgi:hypothetical protein